MCLAVAFDKSKAIGIIIAEVINIIAKIVIRFVVLN